MQNPSERISPRTGNAMPGLYVAFVEKPGDISTDVHLEAPTDDGKAWLCRVDFEHVEKLERGEDVRIGNVLVKGVQKR